jgi:hypothetical protein
MCSAHGIVIQDLENEFPRKPQAVEKLFRDVFCLCWEGEIAVLRVVLTCFGSVWSCFETTDRTGGDFFNRLTYLYSITYG